MSTNPIITGLGLITPLGQNVAQTWTALLAGRYIEDHTKIDGDVTSIALRAAHEAIAEADFERHLSDDSTALIVATSRGPIERWISQNRIGTTCGFGMAELTGAIARELKIGIGPRLTISAACSSGLTALIRACMLLRSGQARRALVIASEASVHPLFIGSFERLGVVASAKIGCRPFDESREGFLMSESAAAVCVEMMPARRGVEIDAIALSSDAENITSGSPDGHALEHAIRTVVQNRPVDLIHAHGTGTVLNDPIELAAIDRAVQPNPGNLPSLFSHKGALGHTLGAAGLVAVVLNVMSHRTGMVPPNIRTIDPLKSRRVQISHQPMPREVRHSIALAAGFGGAIAALGLVQNSPGNSG